MKLNNTELYEFFLEKQILNLHHANSVATSISFILSGGLLSRGEIERSPLTQTIQTSDLKDKELDVWDDVFLDTVDLHGYFPRQNLYGPVLFKFNIDFLLKNDVDIWITKDNPIYWNTFSSNEEKYFQNVDELRVTWDQYARQKKMVTIRKPKNPVLFSSLDEIIIDNPKFQNYDDIHLFEEMKNALLIATESFPELRKKFKIRKCNHQCFCQDNYFHQVSMEQIARLFLPKEHSLFPD